ncbi:tail assembly chaperone [Mycobacterium phage CRB2]|uniref:Tail assembly chaperone n=1 Tax=Mycobacterium phage CRB2 TaxID=2483623 RepID=A0A455LM04_9CAUD|nr:tail assembly chaperone [Mycobacterium phage CRB2]AYP70015.1 tail assembly chaperone [Mycobacterium phage CRB2]
MTTFNADGSTGPADAQLAPPPDLTDHAQEDRPAMTDAERAELAARVKGTATPRTPEERAALLTEDERRADYAAAKSRQLAGLDPQPGDDEKLADDPDADPTVVEAEGPGTTIALAPTVDVSKLGEDWPYDWLEFKGDKLGIRLPTRQALAAFSLASSKYVSLGVKNDLTGLFIARHLSPESYGRVFSRLMDPDENDYDVDTVGELFNAIVMAAVNADKPATPDAAK